MVLTSAGADDGSCFVVTEDMGQQVIVVACIFQQDFKAFSKTFDLSL